MKLYIAGPMSGYPESNYPAFNYAQTELNDVGYDTENPAENMNPDPDDYIEYLRLGIKQLITCEGVAFLPEFGMSKGAMMELYIANVLKMPIRSVEEWLILAYQKRRTDEIDTGPESNPECVRCGHARGLHEIQVGASVPLGYCAHVECDCTMYLPS